MEAGLVVNAAEFLSENWAIALYHEFFSELRYISKTHIASNGQVNQIMEEIHKLSQDEKTSITKEFVEEKLATLDPRIEKYLRVSFFPLF